MNSSFILYHGSGQPDISACAADLFPYTTDSRITHFGSWTLAVNGRFAPAPYLDTSGEKALFLFLNYDVDTEQLLMETYISSGIDGLKAKFPSGGYILLDGEEVIIGHGFSGSLPINYYMDADQILITTELKAVRSQDVIPVALQPLESFQHLPYLKPLDHCLLEGFKRLPGNHLLSIDTDSRDLKIIRCNSFQPSGLSFHKSVERLHDLLDDSIRPWAEANSIGVPLSGGCDSGLVAALASHHRPNIQTFTIGTELTNEFEQAGIMSDFIGSQHQEYVIREDELLSGIINSTFYNELSDPLYAEGYSGLYFAYRMASGQVDSMLTGYGADLTLSNFIHAPDEELSATTAHIVGRTGWTGELSPYVALQFQLHIIQPFMTRDIAEFIRLLPYAYKVSNGREKYIERHLLDHYGLMPRELIYAQKKGLHTGAGIDLLFNRILGIGSDPDYAIKAHFLYHTWHKIFLEKCNLNQIDTNELIFLTRRSAGLN